MGEEPKKKSMHYYCPICGSLITNAIGECHGCLNEEYEWQEPPDYDEMVEYE